MSACPLASGTMKHCRSSFEADQGGGRAARAVLPSRQEPPSCSSAAALEGIRCAYCAFSVSDGVGVALPLLSPTTGGCAAVFISQLRVHTKPCAYRIGVPDRSWKSDVHRLGKAFPFCGPDVYVAVKPGPADTIRFDDERVIRFFRAAHWC